MELIGDVEIDRKKEKKIFHLPEVSRN